MYKNARQAAMPQICRGEFVQWGKKIPDKKLDSCRAFNVHKYDSRPRHANRANGRALKVSKYDSFPRQSSSAAGMPTVATVEHIRLDNIIADYGTPTVATVEH